MVQVTAIVDSHNFVGAWRGQMYECRALPDTSSLAVGDDVICHVLPDNTQLVVILHPCDLAYGVIVIWAGVIGTIPANWRLCDGLDGTPDLENRFIVAAGDLYALGDGGGQDAHTLNHYHSVTNANASIDVSPSHYHTTPAEGSGATQGTATVFALNGGITDGFSEDHAHGFPATTTDTPGGSHDHDWASPGQTDTFNASYQNRPLYRALPYMMHLGGATDFPIGTIVNWSGILANIPPHYHLCDGAGGTHDLSDRFVACEDVGAYYAHAAAGGLDTKNLAHAHTVEVSTQLNIAASSVHSHTGSGESDLTIPPSLRGGAGTYEAFEDEHSHPFNITHSDDSRHIHAASGSVGSGLGIAENRPVYYTLAFIQRIS